MSNPMLETQVRDLVSRRPISIAQDVKMDVAIELMAQEHIRRLPVLGRADKLVGMLTMDDARQAMPRDVAFYDAGADQDKIPEVRKAMSQGVITIAPEAPIALAAQLMVHHSIGALPVVNNGEVVGLITESDIFKFVARGLPPQQPEFAFE
jgi:acetoin utilization protein AcuB